ncbi:MAG: YceH family protein [Solirubrobacterales bacterium]|nr:YceH family protein [Solirubrobacterales bacterium]
MHFESLSAAEQRVLGCLVEKRFTTPDQYPLSLNALRGAASQSTNRDPVVEYDEETVNHAAQRLCQYGLARLASGHSSRAVKYRHLAEERLGVDQEQLAVLCVLLLRGPQTPGELKARTERMVQLGDVHATLEGLAAKRYVVSLGRRPGQKEDRYGHTFGPEEAPQPGAELKASTGIEARLAELEQRVARLEARDR